MPLQKWKKTNKTKQKNSSHFQKRTIFQKGSLSSAPLPQLPLWSYFGATLEMEKKNKQKNSSHFQKGTTFQNGSFREPFWLHFFSQCRLMNSSMALCEIDYLDSHVHLCFILSKLSVYEGVSSTNKISLWCLVFLTETFIKSFITVSEKFTIYQIKPWNILYLFSKLKPESFKI